MSTKRVKFPKDKCIASIERFFNQDKDISIERKTNSLIEFKKGSIWSSGLSAKDAYLKGTITFEENNETIVKIDYDQSLFIAGWAIMIIIYAFIIMYIVLLPDFMSMVSLNPFLLIMVILLVILIFIFPSIGYYFQKKGIKLFNNEIFSHLRDLVPEKPGLTNIQPEKERVIIRERVKVTYSLPENCPKCKVVLRYEEVTMKGPNKVECAYCNSIIDLIEKEI